MDLTSELLCMSFLGLASTIYEGSSQNVRDNIKQVWSMDFQFEATFGIEGLVKSVMTAVTLIRGLTVHMYIAAYLLMFFPFLFKRGITLLLLWMLICGIRSVIVNLVVLMTGCFVCSMHSQLKPACFEFTAAKGIELACSVYMWLSVNDFYNSERSTRMRKTSRVTSTSSKHKIEASEGGRSSMAAPSAESFLDSNGHSDESLLMHQFDESSNNSETQVEISGEAEAENLDNSDDSILVKAMDDWLMILAFGFKGNKKGSDHNDPRSILNMTPEDLQQLQNRIKKKMDMITKEYKKRKSERKDKGTNLGKVASKITNDGHSEASKKQPTTQTTGIQTAAPSKKLKRALTGNTQRGDLTEAGPYDNKKFDEER